MKLVILGAPGAGKGTQAGLLADRLGIPTISTGNLLRAAMQQGTDLGKQVKEAMDAGKLVSDELIIQLVKERLGQEDCKDGYLLDGFPRTLAQAKALSGFAKIDGALSIEVSDSEIEHRMEGRRICSKCQATYHVEDNPPKVEGICDKCGGQLVIRKDDTHDVVENRLHIYHEETEPVKEYYRQEGLLLAVRGQKKLADTTQLVFDALGISL
ncbi:adenylate kinase [Intestinimonas butyriciproducens]|uniref:adenylate kinase n=1 Tax=Intestinimonas butyriciproducens TaxID=1297617 RepID=UPI00195EF4C3|nr:adenylate kinase [Intestinimonas butyriciproducens]MBM6917164.1 adenylate kinase [Intestinimonas butyriciproducens]